MLFAGWEVRIVKNCDLGPENAALTGPTLRRQITFYFFSCSKLVLHIITNGFFYSTLSIFKNSPQRRNNSDTR